MSVDPFVLHPQPRVNVQRQTTQKSHTYEGPSARTFNPRNRPKSHHIEPSTNVFINYFPPEYTEYDLRELCKPYGQILCSKIMINLETGESKCFGFVRFATLEQSQAAIRNLNGKCIGTKRLLAKYAESNEKKEIISPTIYVKRIPLTASQQAIYDLFSRFGVITQMRVHSIEAIDPQYWRCFITYQNVSSAANAISVMNNQIIQEKTRPIHVHYADESKINSSVQPTERFSVLDLARDERTLLPSFFFM